MSASVRLTQIDGKLPNLALARLGAWHRQQGHEVHFSRSATRDVFEPKRYDFAYGSSIFAFSKEKVERFAANFPEAAIGGTGVDPDGERTVEKIAPGVTDLADFTFWPDFNASLGYTQRGCRLKCRFCVVPKKEGANRSVGTLHDIWRGNGRPKHIHLLDNDFFGQPWWRERIEEARTGGFKLSFSQGINVRMVTDEVAEALASVDFRDASFGKRRLYVAWDNLKDEGVFMRGVDTLERAGIRPTQLMAYMLIGYDRKETWERIFHRFDAMVARGIDPYPMPFDQTSRPHKRFQRWVVTRAYRNVPFDRYDPSAKGIRFDRQGKQLDIFGEAA
ncbi:hypothetical protein ACLNGM_15250 [Aureimonas phyllosphaerae]|uniref:hypothetical protein n=1 Tax=Aureimonas phyllosphaerae TaxID=1166078 RepID=UPI003A5C2E7D